MHQRLGADRDLVAEDGGDFVGVAGAADVAEQRHPVHGRAQVFVEPGGLANRCREQARPQLRLERLAERVVLCECQRGDEFAEAKRCVEMGSPPDVSTLAVAQDLLTARDSVSRTGCAALQLVHQFHLTDPLGRISSDRHSADPRNVVLSPIGKAKKGNVNPAKTQVSDPQVMAAHIKRVANHRL